MNTTDILLVEDNPNDASLTIRALKKRNVTNRIIHVQDGESALNLLFNNNELGELKPKVVLLDLKLPKLDGLDVLRKIRADKRTRLLPVVVLTSSCEEKDVIESYNLGANSYIVKPVDFENFSEAVSKLGLYWLLLNQPIR